MKINKFLKIIKSQEKWKKALIFNNAEVTYGELCGSIRSIQSKLQANGFKQGDIIALPLINSVDYYLMFFAIINKYICLPINIDLEKDELKFLLKKSGAKAIIFPHGQGDKYSKINIAQLTYSKKENNFFLKLIKKSKASAGLTKKVLDNSTMVILTTSGTTAKQKFVPLTPDNIKAGAENLTKILNLTKKDVCLNIMPPFHVHGLMVTLTTLISGGSLICAPIFNGKIFFELFNKYKPTWFTGSPTVHNAILRYLEINKIKVKNEKLRFIRSSSASLPLSVLKRLEKSFQVPVSESYGMTEACLQITAHPLPPKIRKIGSVGIPVGLNIKIISKNNRELARGEIGEILIKGKNVIKDYYLSSVEEKKLFIKGWLRTGDLGYIDNDGYLYIVGRIKEMINKGGENVSPKEIDEALLKHPEIDQVATFGVPHLTLGEDINAAVVLKKIEKKINPEKIRIFLIDKISQFKIPTKIYILKEMPKSPTGKIKRNLLPKLLKI